MRVNLNIQRNGYITAKVLQDILEPFAEEVANVLGNLKDQNDELRGEVKALRRELDTERRLRLSMRR
ncbi:hypothetical protein [Sulfitobacter sp. PS-8MA]|uniref:hypothetical protein n=1 Tax=Sulfitobacter sp. PS-8MA TaxID=3237707 RepID=UPI0034C60EE7